MTFWQRNVSTAAGLVLAASALCLTRVSVSVFANLAAVATKKRPECEDGIPPAAMVLLVEVFKLIMAATLLWHTAPSVEQQKPPDPESPSSEKSTDASALSALTSQLTRNLAMFAPLAFFYCIGNVLLLVALDSMAAPVYELLSTLRIPFSAALAWAFAQSGALLRLPQYTALAMLMAANVLAHWHLDAASAPAARDVALVLVSQACSQVANLLFELIAKERFRAVSIHLQNAQLYFWGVLFNAGAYVFMQHRSGGLSFAWLRCATPWHWCLVAGLASNGIITGIVVKHHGNVASVVAQSFAVHLAALLSHFLTSFAPSAHFMLAALLAQAAILLYNKDALSKKPPS